MGYLKYNFKLIDERKLYPFVNKWKELLDYHTGIDTSWTVRKNTKGFLLEGDYDITYEHIIGADVKFEFASSSEISLSKTIPPYDYLTQVLLYLMARETINLGGGYFWREGYEPIMLNSSNLQLFYDYFHWESIDLERIKLPHLLAKNMEGFSEDYSGNYGL